MKKLYENIENIYIKGGIDQLSEVVKVMDISLQNIAENTNLLVEYLIKYSASNKGAQYEKVINTSMFLAKTMCNRAEELNDMQNQIVAYQNKIYRYEDMSGNAPQPNPFLVRPPHINTDTSAVQFNRSEMVEVVTILRKYGEAVIDQIKKINEKKNDISTVWLDTQYNDFAAFIDEISNNTVEAIKIFEEYILYLEEKIKELS